MRTASINHSQTRDDNLKVNIDLKCPFEFRVAYWTNDTELMRPTDPRKRIRGRIAKKERGRNSQTADGPGTSKARVLEGNGARWKNCLDVKT